MEEFTITAQQPETVDLTPKATTIEKLQPHTNNKNAQVLTNQQLQAKRDNDFQVTQIASREDVRMTNEIIPGTTLESTGNKRSL